MSRPLNGDLKRHLYHFLTAFLLTAGMALCAFGAIFPAHGAKPVLLWSAAFSLLFEGFSLLKGRLRWLLPLLLIALLIGLAALGLGPGHTLWQLIKAVYLSLRGMPDAVQPYADAARIALCLFFALLSSLMAWDASFPLSCFCVITTAVLCMVLGGNENTLLYSLPAFAGLVMVLGGQKEKRLSALLIAGAAVMAAFLLLPQTPQTAEPFRKAAEKVRQTIEDYLFFTDYRASFTLTSEGYQPLEDRLGGPATPEKRDVMEVETEETLLLRGKTYDAYSGLNWYDTLSARRYLYISPRYEALKNDLFALQKPLTGKDTFREKTVRVRMLQSGTTTLFAPAFTRQLQMENERMVLYYNTASELFLTRNTEENDAYSLTFLSLDPDSETTQAAAAACAPLSDPYYETALNQYLALPSHIQQEIFDLADQAVGDAETPYGKALRIRDFLRHNYRYTLDAEIPPDNVDFTAWFLLGEKEGYCTYFATAMTVLCRIAGIPARYVTGYLAVPDENGVAHVQGRDAHAWTEIYLNGLGWLEMDATPRGDNEGQNEDPNGNESDPLPPQASPSPAPTPSPSPDDSPSEAPTPSPSQAPAPTPESTQPPSDSPESDPEKPDKPFPWLLLLLIVLLALLLLRYFLTEPLRHAARRPGEAPHILMRAILGLLTLQELRRSPQETLQAFAARADAALEGKGLPALSPLMDQYSALVYGHHAQESAAPYRDIYLRFRAAASRPGRAILALRRMLHGA